MTRGGFRAAAAVVVLLLLAGLGWLFLAPARAPVVDSTSERAIRKPTSESGEEAEARAAATERPATAEPPSEGKQVVTRPEEPTIPGICVLDDGTPLPGVRVDVTLQESSDGSTLGEESATGVDGTFGAYPDKTIELSHRWAQAVSVEGGALKETGRKAVLRSDAGATAVRVLFRDDPGTAHVRLVDSSSLQPITSTRGLRLTYLFGTNLSGRAVYEVPAEDDWVAIAPRNLGGWVPIREGALPEDLGIETDPVGVVVEFASPGYAPKRVPLPDIRGRIQVRADPIPSCVIGAIGVERTWHRSGPAVSATIRGQDGRPAVVNSEVRGLPSGWGPFRIDDLPTGSWVLEVSFSTGSSVARVRREFDYRGTTVDLGPIEAKAGAAVRARAVDSEGTPMPQARVVVVRDGEDPEKAAALAAGDGGWVAYADLEPNAGHRVVVLGLPRPLEKPVQTSSDGKPVEVELAWEERLVPCRITLVVDGKAVANSDGSTTIPATVHESPLPREAGAWHKDGTFAAKLVPGTYRFSAYATPEGGGDLVLFGGEVTVPPGDSFETRLELRREDR